jgi:hypothetical protein
MAAGTRSDAGLLGMHPRPHVANDHELSHASVGVLRERLSLRETCTEGR